MRNRKVMGRTQKRVKQQKNRCGRNVELRNNQHLCSAIPSLPPKADDVFQWLSASIFCLSPFANPKWRWHCPPTGPRVATVCQIVNQPLLLIRSLTVNVKHEWHWCFNTFRRLRQEVTNRTPSVNEKETFRLHVLIYFLLLHNVTWHHFLANDSAK